MRQKPTIPDVQVKGYNGNTNIKGAGEKIAFTKEIQEEIIRCAFDPIYFCENYIQIVHVDHGLIPLKLYEYQKDIINSITTNRRVAVNTSRQAGKTTTAAAIILHYVLFNSMKTVGLLANKGDSAREILDRIQIAYEYLPKWLQQGVVEWNKGSVRLENGSKIIAAATSSSAIRGKSVAFLYIDETAFVENWDEFFASVFPTIASGKQTKILFTSTPNGLNHFYKTCMGAKEGRNGYQYIEVPWTSVPGRDDEWKQETLEGLDFDIGKFGQEFCCEFQGSSGTLIEGGKLKTLFHEIPLSQSGGTKLYAPPKKENTYMIVVDVSRGKGIDYSALQVMDITTMPYRQVLTFRDNMITPIDYADIIFQICKAYNEAYILVEVNDIGEQVADILHFDLEVETILSTESAGRAGKRISGGFGKNVDKGIRTTKSVKSIGCNMLKMLIEQEQMIVVDEDTIGELSTFSRRGVSYEAESGKNDDLVMCLVLFSWLTDQSFFKELTEIETLQALKQRSESDLMDDMLPLGFNSDDMLDEYKQNEDNTSWFNY